MQNQRKKIQTVIKNTQQQWGSPDIHSVGGAPHNWAFRSSSSIH